MPAELGRHRPARDGTRPRPFASRLRQGISPSALVAELKTLAGVESVESAPRRMTLARVSSPVNSGLECGDDRVRIVDAATPGSAADSLQGRPESSIVGQVGVGREQGVRRSVGEHARCLAAGSNSTPSAPTRSSEPSRLNAVDDDANQIAVAQLADRSAGQRLGADVADAGAGRDAGEPGVGQDGDLLAERQVSQAPP